MDSFGTIGPGAGARKRLRPQIKAPPATLPQALGAPMVAEKTALPVFELAMFALASAHTSFGSHQIRLALYSFLAVLT